MTFDLSIRANGDSQKAAEPWVNASVELFVRLSDLLEYLQEYRKHHPLSANLGDLKLAVRFARSANQLAGEGNAEEAQRHYAAAIHYFDGHQNGMIAAAELQRSETAKAPAERQPINVTIPLTVNPVIDRSGGSMLVTRDRDGLISGLQPAK